MITIFYLETCMTNDGRDIHKYCHFPFIHNGKSHAKCVYEQSSGKFWCATEVHPDTNEMIEGRSGYCEPDCPKEYDTLGFRTLKNCQDSTPLCTYLKTHCGKEDVEKACQKTCNLCLGAGTSSLFNE